MRANNLISLKNLAVLVGAAAAVTLPGGASAQSGASLAPGEVRAEDLPNDDGRVLTVHWTPGTTPAATFRLERADAPDATEWTTVAKEVSGTDTSYRDKFDEADAQDWYYRVTAVAEDGTEATSPAAGPFRAVESWYHTRRTVVLLFIVLFSAMIGYFLQAAKRSAEEMYIRRIPGIDAIEEAIGRATEMGRPVLYVPGIEEMYDIQTIASMLILGKVSEMVARYSSEVIVSNRVPFVMTVAEEVVKQGFYNAGRPDAHKPENVRFISDEQFAFTAGTNGIMLRERPATNLFLGRFFAESLILAETGFQAKAIQVAGTAEVTQLPFFIAACDYTLIGEELFAASAYLSRDPMILSTLKAADWFKVIVVLAILAGAVAETAGYSDFRALFDVSGD